MEKGRKERMTEKQREGGSDTEGPGYNSSRDLRGRCRLDCRWSRLFPQPHRLRVTEVPWHHCMSFKVLATMCQIVSDFQERFQSFSNAFIHFSWMLLSMFKWRCMAKWLLFVTVKALMSRIVKSRQSKPSHTHPQNSILRRPNSQDSWVFENKKQKCSIKRIGAPICWFWLIGSSRIFLL